MNTNMPILSKHGHMVASNLTLSGKYGTTMPFLCSEYYVITPQKQHMIPAELPDYPWQKVGTDPFHYKEFNYLVVVDHASRYPEIIALCRTTPAASSLYLKTHLVSRSCS